MPSSGALSEEIEWIWKTIIFWRKEVEKLNKTDIVNAVSEKSSLSKKDSAAALDATLEAIKESLAKGEKVQFIGFGTYDVREKAARTGRHPKTGEPIQIPAKNAVRFRAGTALKDAVAD